MPALTCNNCLQQRHESDRLRLENNNLRRDLKNLKHALENSQKSEKALRDRCVIRQDALYMYTWLQMKPYRVFEDKFDIAVSDAYYIYVGIRQTC